MPLVRLYPEISNECEPFSVFVVYLETVFLDSDPISSRNKDSDQIKGSGDGILSEKRKRAIRGGGGRTRRRSGGGSAGGGQDLLGEGEAATTLNSCPSATTSLLGVWAEYLRLPLTEPIKQESAAYAGTSRDVFLKRFSKLFPCFFFK
jgi:hypothetical protein